MAGIIDGEDNTKMLADDESCDDVELESGSPDRYQKSYATLKFLPYYDVLDEENDEYVDKILKNLTKTVLCYDFQIGLITYTRSLKGYFVLYGMKITKQQHIKLVNFYYELITMESCPLSLICDFVDMYNTLLKKPTLLTRDDIVIPWRPLFDTLDRCVYHRKYTLTAAMSVKLERFLKEAIRYSNIYFEKNILQDIIDEFQPYLCPSSPKMVHGLRMLNTFLPFLDPDVEAEVNKYLEFLLEFCNVWNNGPTWDWPMMNILGKAAWNRHGSFNWTPYLPLVYSRLMKGLELPVHFKNAKNTSTESARNFDFRAAASWIVATLGNDPEALKNLKNFLETVETYFNPLNVGRWSLPLLSLLNELVNLFTLRLKRERYLDNSKRWWQRINPDRKLTDEDIEEFVRITSELVLDFYLDLQSAGFLLKHLAYIRPDIIIPAVLEKYESMVETVTEPRKYLIALRWVTIIIVPMATCRKNEDGFDGRKYVIPFALSLLPAIDPNDLMKTMSALGILHCLFCVVPFVDCSSLCGNMEDEELKEICSATGCLEDFSLQFLDRIINLIENRTHENTRMADSRIAPSQAINAEDSGLEKFMWAVFHRLATNSSSKITKAVGKKIIAYALSTTLETDVSGRLFASICQAYTVARPDIMLPKFLPQLCKLIQEAITDDIVDDEELEKTLQFHLLLLSFIVETVGTELLKYKTDIEDTLFAILKLNGKKAYAFASSTILRFLNSLVLIYPVENRLIQTDVDDPNYLAVNDWGITMEPKDITSKWHVPSTEELAWAKSVFLKIYAEYVSYIRQPETLIMSNDVLNKKLLKMLNILQFALEGVHTVIPFWDDVPIDSDETSMDIKPVRIAFGIPHVDITDPFTNENIKKCYFEIYSKIKDYLDAYKSDDTEAYIIIIRGLDNLIVPNFEPDRRMMLPLKSNNGTNLNNSLKPRKKYTRSNQIARAFETHHKRVRISACTTWTESHHLIMKKLFELCTNRYAKVRIFAQGRFCRILDAFSPIIARGLSPLFVEKLKNGVSHDEYKGTLYTLLTSKVSPILVSSWEGVSMLWIALIRSPFSEKNSIIKCMDAIRRTLSQSFIFFPLVEKTSQTLQNLARDLITPEAFKSLGELNPLKSQELNKNVFQNLISQLLESLDAGHNHWRQQVLCANMLSVLVVEDMELPKKMAEFFFDSLISKTPEIRSTALTTLNWLLALFKRKYPTVNVNTRTGLTFAEGESIHSVLQYKSNPSDDAFATGKLTVVDENGGSVPKFYVHKTYFGFTPLPLQLKVKISPSNYSDFTDPSLSQPVRMILEVTKSYFENPEYVKNLVATWTQEERIKGVALKRTQIFKNITRNNGPEALKHILNIIPELGKDKDQWKQRCAADILAGVLHGLKLWDDESIEQLWSTLKPVLYDCLDNVTQETMKHWSNAMVIPNSSRDPNKMRFFVEFMKERFIKSLKTAQTTSVDASKNMNFFDNVIANFHWRGGDMFEDILNLVKIHILDNPIPYVTVRDQLGRLLGDVFEWAVESPLKLGCSVAPKYEPFVELVFESLKNLVEESTKYRANVGDNGKQENTEAGKLLLKYKSTVEWLIAVCWDMETTIPPVVFRFIPLLCHFESYESDPEAAQLSTVALSGLARTLLLPPNVDPLFSQLQEAASSSSWRTRLCVVEFLKVLALHNANVFASSEQLSDKIVNLVLKLLSDRKLEVRALAASVLSGFLHCLIIQKPMELLKTFQRQARQFSQKRQNGLKTTPKVAVTPEDIEAAHSMILGLCAFVDAHPYDCPSFLPEVLITLSTHLHDPEPIPSTLRKCLSNFRRTHHDNWAVHKTKFSEDQLFILTDIFVSPCYYA